MCSELHGSSPPLFYGGDLKISDQNNGGGGGGGELSKKLNLEGGTKFKGDLQF